MELHFVSVYRQTRTKGRSGKMLAKKFKIGLQEE